MLIAPSSRSGMPPRLALIARPTPRARLPWYGRMLIMGFAPQAIVPYAAVSFNALPRSLPEQSRFLELAGFGDARIMLTAPARLRYNCSNELNNASSLPGMPARAPASQGFKGASFALRERVSKTALRTALLRQGV